MQHVLKHRFQQLLAVLLLVLSAVLVNGVRETASASAAGTVRVVNKEDAGHQLSRFDVAGDSLDAHDGSVLKVGKLFYLYGTSYACGYQYTVNSSFCGFKAYSSPDLVHWTDRGYVVAPSGCSYCFRP